MFSFYKWAQVNNNKAHLLNILLFLILTCGFYGYSLFFPTVYPKLSITNTILTNEHIQKQHVAVLSLLDRRYLFNCENSFSVDFCSDINPQINIIKMEYEELNCYSTKIYTCDAIITQGLFATKDGKTISYEVTTSKLNQYQLLVRNLAWGQNFLLLLLFNFIILIFIRKKPLFKPS